MALHEAGVLTVTTECEKQASSAQKSDHHCLIDARGAEPAEKGVVRLAQLLKRTYNGLVVDTSAESLSVSPHHKLYINEKETNIYIGSAFLTPWFLNIPGLDTCAKFSRNIGPATDLKSATKSTYVILKEARRRRRSINRS